MPDKKTPRTGAGDVVRLKSLDAVKRYLRETGDTDAFVFRAGGEYVVVVRLGNRPAKIPGHYFLGEKHGR